MLAFVDDETLVKVADVLGQEDAIQIISILKDADEITDDQIANKTGIRLNSVRKILYKFFDHSLVSLRRSRDRNTGWFIFHWKLQPDQLEGFILNQKKHVLQKLDTRLNYEKNHDFYHCGNPECKRLPFEEALESIFKCPNCDKPMMHFDNGKVIEVLSEKVGKLRKELGEKKAAI
jgi:transcription initiation factor TFIIE subunit alpha